MIYVLFGWGSDETSKIIGIFSEKELAEDAKAKINPDKSWTDIVIEEFEIDIVSNKSIFYEIQFDYIKSKKTFTLKHVFTYVGEKKGQDDRISFSTMIPANGESKKYIIVKYIEMDVFSANAQTAINMAVQSVKDEFEKKLIKLTYKEQNPFEL